jgi:alkanesulfonate monooxygenase SsuD/methylene tetrahydromethanopterin reductase-like flavin-dependent oxidoreductase (luciferase family)
MRQGVREALLKADARNVAGEARPANVGGVLPTTFIGSPDRVVEQVKQCREQVGAGVIDLMFHNPGDDPDALMDRLELFGRKVLPRIREV